MPNTQDPRGICATCRYFIDDMKEIDQELDFITQQGVYIPTSERVLSARGIAIGDKLERRIHNYKHMAEAFTRLGFRPEDFGLCEKGGPDSGPARFVHRQAGAIKTPGGECTRWREKSPIFTIRSADWRTKREADIMRRRTDDSPKEP